MNVKTPDKRLTWAQIRERYPHQWIGVTNIETVQAKDAMVEFVSGDMIN